MSNCTLLSKYAEALETLQREFNTDASHGASLPVNSQEEDEVTTALGSGREMDEREAVQIMANATAYYDLAFRRFTDFCALSIEHFLYRGWCKVVDRAFRARLEGITTPDQWNSLLTESVQGADKRIELDCKLQNLKKIQAEIRVHMPPDAEVEADDMLVVLRNGPDLVLSYKHASRYFLLHLFGPKNLACFDRQDLKTRAEHHIVTVSHGCFGSNSRVLP